MKPRPHTLFFVAIIVLAGSPGVSQTPQSAPPPDAAVAVKQSLSLSAHGRCKEALQLLKKSGARISDKDLKLKAGMATVHCAMNREQVDTALEAIQILNREFPNDPAVLYLSTHAYSDLSTRAALELARLAPDSYQAHELNAEALEMQGKWDDALVEYHKILEQSPELPGIHFRIGRLILSRPETPTMREDATKEFEAELKIDPNNAGAEYILGEFARQQGLWEEAIRRFTKVTQLDAALVDASFGLGTSFLGDGKPLQAIAPLEVYVRARPGNPAGHYQLAMAYNRVGRKEDAKREAERQRETSEKIDQEKQKAEPAPQPGGAPQPPGPPE